MAKAQMMMPDDFLERLSKLGDKSDEISEKVLKAGGEVVLQKVKSSLSTVIGKSTKYESRSTGELESSLGLSAWIRTATTTSKSVLLNRVKMAKAMRRSPTSSNTESTANPPGLF